MARSWSVLARARGVGERIAAFWASVSGALWRARASSSLPPPLEYATHSVVRGAPSGAARDLGAVALGGWLPQGALDKCAIVARACAKHVAVLEILFENDERRTACGHVLELREGQLLLVTNLHCVLWRNLRAAQIIVRGAQPPHVELARVQLFSAGRWLLSSQAAARRAGAVGPVFGIGFWGVRSDFVAIPLASSALNWPAGACAPILPPARAARVARGDTVLTVACLAGVGVLQHITARWWIGGVAGPAVQFGVVENVSDAHFTHRGASAFAGFSGAPVFVICRDGAMRYAGVHIGGEGGVSVAARLVVDAERGGDAAEQLLDAPPRCDAACRR